MPSSQNTLLFPLTSLSTNSFNNSYWSPNWQLPLRSLLWPLNLGQMTPLCPIEPQATVHLRVYFKCLFVCQYLPLDLHSPKRQSLPTGDYWALDIRLTQIKYAGGAKYMPGDSARWLNKVSLIVSPSQQQQSGIHPQTKVPLWKLWEPAP